MYLPFLQPFSGNEATPYLILKVENPVRLRWPQTNQWRKEEWKQTGEEIESGNGNTVFFGP